MSPMMRIALPMLAAASTAYAACSATATATIQNSGDASALSTCSTFSGSIAIATGTTDDIALDGVQKITGDLVVSSNENLKRLGGDSLEEIEGSLTLDNVRDLNTVGFPKLKTVDTIKFNALPNLQQLGFDAEVTKASSVDIQNTQLQSLKGLNIETVDEVFVANNIYITEIAMQLGNVSNALTLADNNPDVNVSFPNLMWAFNLTFRSCSSVEVPSLETLNGSLGLYNNGFTSFSAPNLTEVGGALAFVSNTELTNISFPSLTTVTENLQIANNTKLSEIDGFPNLKTVGASFDMYGNMTKVETPALSDVRGAFNLQSTEDLGTTCDDSYKPLKDKKQIKGKYFCEGKLEEVGGEGTGEANSKGGDSSSSKKGAAASLNVQNGALALAGLAAVLLL